MSEENSVYMENRIKNLGGIFCRGWFIYYPLCVRFSETMWFKVKTAWLDRKFKWKSPNY